MAPLPPSPFLSFTGCADHCQVETAAASPILTGTVDAAADYTEQLYPRFEPDLGALYDAIVPPEPPVFLRSPSQAFIRALIELAR